MGNSQNSNIIWKSKQHSKKVGRNVQIVNFELQILKRFSSLLGLLKRDHFIPISCETHEKMVCFRVPDIAIMTKVKYSDIYETY
jgi:hypothetical protein